RGTGLAEDYVYLAEGLLGLWEATFDADWAEAAQRLAGKLLEEFWDPDRGGLFSTGHEGEQLGLRRKDRIHRIPPPPNAVAATVPGAPDRAKRHAHRLRRPARRLQAAGERPRRVRPPAPGRRPAGLGDRQPCGAARPLHPPSHVALRPARQPAVDRSAQGARLL